MKLSKVVINKKQSVGIKQVYDICVPPEHYYILKNGIISHNSGFIYASSIVVALQRLKLKEDEEGNKTADVKGIRSKVKVMKTRFNQPFQEAELKIPWDTGLDPYSGLFEFFESKGILTKEGHRYSYTDINDVKHSYFKKEWWSNKDGCLDTVMNEFYTIYDPKSGTFEEYIDEENELILNDEETNDVE